MKRPPLSYIKTFSRQNGGAVPSIGDQILKGEGQRRTLEQKTSWNKVTSITINIVTFREF